MYKQPVFRQIGFNQIIYKPFILENHTLKTVIHKIVEFS